MKTPFPFLAALCAALVLFPAAADPPQSGGSVSDFAGVLDAGDKARLESLADEVRRTTGAQIAVVSVKSVAPYGGLEEYAAALFNRWGIGRREKDDGVLLILTLEERDVRIETGYGLEGALPDSLCGRILDREVLPELREGRYSTGLLRGAQAIAAVIAKENGLDPASLGLEEETVNAGENREGQRGSALGNVIFITLSMVFFILIPLTFRRRRRGPGSRPGGFGPGGYGGTFRSGGGFSGGGGFGGGRSGGGGASRGF